MDETDLARMVIASWLYDDFDLVSREEVEVALDHVPSDLILSTEKDDQDRLLFLRTFCDGFVLQHRAMTGNLRQPFAFGTLQ